MRNTNRWILLGLAVLIASIVTSAQGGVLKEVQEIAAQAGISGGLVVHVGSSDGRLTATLRLGSSFVVHGLSHDPTQIAAAREYIRSLDVYGPVSVTLFDGVNLPYADNLVNLLVVSGTECRVPEDEIRRVLAPGGVAVSHDCPSCIPKEQAESDKGSGWENRGLAQSKGDNGYAVFQKPVPSEIDEWPHLLHGSDNNAVANDTVVGPPRRMQWTAGPAWCRSHEFLSSFATMVSAGGRVFYVFDEGLTGVTEEGIPTRWTLIARDAFNGIFLWKRPLANTESGLGRALRATPPIINRNLVAQEDVLYTTDGLRGPVVFLDAGTGQLLKRVDGTAGTEELILSDHILITRVNSETQKGLFGIHRESGEILWFKDEETYTPVSMAAANGNLVYGNRKQLVCLKLADGQEAWRVDKPDLKSYSYSRGPTIILADDKILIGSSSGVEALHKATGQQAWQVSGSGGAMRGGDLLVARGLAWHASKDGIVGLDLATGQVKKTLDPTSVFSQGHHLRCYNAKGTDRFLLTTNRGVEFVALDDTPHTQNDWTRGACRYGVMPANGLLYVPPHPCFCYAGAMMTGLNAYAPAPIMAPRSFTPSSRLVKGAAYGTVTGLGAFPAGDWPMYRRDPRRTGASPADVPKKLARGWKVELGGKLTPPVTAAGRVLVSAVDAHTLFALDVETGSELWHFVAGGRIDSPPAVAGDCVLFGCADGLVYCLRFTDGAEVWRFRAAPEQRLIVDNNQVESAWRVHGSVLLRDGVIYCTAGRSSFLDDGIFLYGLDPATGKVIYESRLDTWARTRKDAESEPFLPAFHIEGTRSDLLVSEGDYIFLGQMKFTPSLELVDSPYRPGLSEYQTDRGAPDAFGPIVHEVAGSDLDFVDQDTIAQYPQMAKSWFRRGHMGAREVGRHLLATGGFLDDSYFHRTYWMYGDVWPSYYIANIASRTGQLLVVGPKRTYGVQAYPQRVKLSPMFKPGAKGYLLFADDNDNDQVLDDKDWGRDKGMGFSRMRPPVWHAWIPVRIRAMTLADDRLFVAGPPDVVDPDDPMASFEGRKDAMLWVFDAQDGSKLGEYALDAPPVFDGMIAAGRILISQTNGRLVCIQKR